MYIALYCVLLYTQSTLQSCGWGGGLSPQPPPVCSIHLDDAMTATGERDRANQVYTLTTHQLQVERRERDRANQVYALTTHQLQVERRESHWANQVYTLTTHQLQVERRERHRDNQVYALTTHQLQVERRESHRAKCMGIIRRPWLIRASGENLARTPGLHPYSLREVSLDF